jgi:prenyltransferase beta subunit
LIIITSLIPFSLAKQRKSYLTDYIISTRIEQTGFSNSQESDIFSYEATANALNILGHYNLYEEPGAWGAIIANVNITLFQNSLVAKIMPQIYQSGVVIYDLYYLYRSLDLLEYSISSTHISTTQTYLEDSNQTTGGFAPINISTTASLISTYYVIQLYSQIGKLNQINKNLHKEWILNCTNYDGGFGGNSSLPSTLLNTYYGLLALDILGSLNELPNPSETLNYLKSFYISDQSDLENFGGYLPDNYTSIALLSSTYYCVKALALLDITQLNNESTINWVLTRQNFEDGGFTENSDGADQKTSSVISSFFAFEILRTFDTELSMLNEDVWMVEFSWLILLIVLSVIGVVAMIMIGIWRKRRI